MKILNFGSINIDLVYRVDHTVRPGETISSRDLSIHAGGKGANQSAALAKAGVKVFHAGKIGSDGEWILEKLRSFGVNTDFVFNAAEKTGHAVIQVSGSGENAIVLYGGGNLEITEDDVISVLDHFNTGDILLLQNEINNIPFIMETAADKGMRIIFNPAPFDNAVLSYPLETVDVFIVNETEGMGLSGEESGNSEKIMDKLVSLFPGKDIILTLGADGVLSGRDEQRVSSGIIEVPVVDTTAAGDTFIGYYLSGVVESLKAEILLERACAASSITVTRLGAMEAIPEKIEVEEILKK